MGTVKFDISEEQYEVIQDLIKQGVYGSIQEFVTAAMKQYLDANAPEVIEQLDRDGFDWKEGFLCSITPNPPESEKNPEIAQ
jgi:Arc/MetJ-type ribon-helix-helix transcriptional regulator